MKWTIKEIKQIAKAFILGDITMATSAKNYTDEMVASMTQAYQANPSRETVDNLASQFGKTFKHPDSRGLHVVGRLTREQQPAIWAGSWQSLLKNYWDRC